MKIPSYTDLQQVQCCDNGESLLNLTQHYPHLHCHYRREDSRIDSVWVRTSVAEKLQCVDAKLKAKNPAMQLLIVEGYRHPFYQERYFLQQLLNEYKKTPHLNFESLIERANSCVALPSVAGHPTGGAVDVTLAYKGKELAMGCAIADFSNPALIPTFASNVTAEAATNRRLLHDLMLAEGFAPYYGEWWHFSFGDREWAVFYERSHTLYAPIEDLFDLLQDRLHRVNGFGSNEDGIISRKSS